MPGQIEMPGQIAEKNRIGGSEVTNALAQFSERLRLLGST